MKSKILMIVLLVSLAANLSIAATVGYHFWKAAPKTEVAPCFQGPSDQHLYQLLGLSEQQLSQIKPMAHAFHAKLKQLSADVADQRNQLMGLVKQDEPDLDRIKAVQNELAAFQGQIQDEVVAHILQIKQILNPQQKARFFQLLGQSMQAFEHPWQAKER